VLCAIHTLTCREL